MINWQTQATNAICGCINVPGDKSISHRSMMFGALAEGQTRIRGFLTGEDCLATRCAFEAMGVTIRNLDEEVVIDGVGLSGLQAPQHAIDVGNSGTGMRLLAGVLVGQAFSSTLIGDASLMQRPMQRIAKPLSAMGANIATAENGCAPITIQAVPQLCGIHYQQHVASAQVKSAILLAGLYAKGTMTIFEPGISRDHTERMLRQFGCAVKTTLDGEGRLTTMLGGQRLIASNINVPADISSAAFFMVAASIVRGEASLSQSLTLKQIGINPTRTGIIDILKQMGAHLNALNVVDAAEPVADIEISPSELTGIDVPKSCVALAIDEFPVIFIAAACARGKFVLRHAKELRVKESDRIAVMAEGLQALGVDCQVLDDGIIIHGNPDEPFPYAATINSHGDHRIAMAFAVAGIRATHPITITDCANVATSFPDFLALATQVGMTINVEEK